MFRFLVVWVPRIKILFVYCEVMFDDEKQKMKKENGSNKKDINKKTQQMAKFILPKTQRNYY